MRNPPKLLKRLGLALIATVALAVVTVVWIVPRVIVGQLESRLGGTVEIQGWWVDGRSAGVRGLKVHEGPTVESPVWASAERLDGPGPRRSVRGETSPGKVQLYGPSLLVRLDRKGDLLTRIGASSGAGGMGSASVPVVVADGARVEVRQEGRPSMVVNGVTLRLAPDGDQLAGAAVQRPAVGTDRGPRTGRPGVQDRPGRHEVDGQRLGHARKSGGDPVRPDGGLGQRRADRRRGRKHDRRAGRVRRPSTRVRTEIVLRGTTVASKTLGLTAERTSGAW